MRTIKPKPKRVQRAVQHMLPDFNLLPYDGYIRLRSAFTRSLATTKAWTLSTDFQNNVNAALEREKTS
jgi:hypothetical protein